MNRVFGIETEYGITVDGQETVDVVQESIEVVRSYTEHGAAMKWDYDLEDPHKDARGFRAKELLQDTDEAAYYEIDKNRPLSFEEIKGDLVLSNGARFYNDHAHPEYSTPECTTLHELIAQDKAGERVLWECARRRNARIADGQPERTVRLYKNNTDFVGHSYGCHDNYLMAREVPWDRIVTGTVPFLVTRQIFAGAGKIGVEGEENTPRPGVFQISQRADFFSVLVSIDTMNRRPIVNTRDEPHADTSKYRRFHVIIGDANMNEVATALKIGTTALVLELIEKDRAPALQLANAVEAAKSISRDGSYDWLVELADGRKISAIEIQRIYLDAARRYCDQSNEEARWVLAEWEAILNDLQADPMRCTDRIDWVAKKYLLSTFRDAEHLDWADPWLQSIDMEYHNIDPVAGLYHEMLRTCAVRRFLKEDEIRDAIFQPPTTTRAFFRGRAVAKFNAFISSIQWDEVVFRTPLGPRAVPLTSAFGDAALDALADRIQRAETVSDLFA
ncbi:MAG: depupylase/deamidase Dop [Chthoniobacteraceae bacterium]|nr:depupylase/deamidase Dop [Chthoniobacteraceae bacterium]